MVTGRMVSEAYVIEKVKEGVFATNFPDAFRKFGTGFIAISPVYPSCALLVSKLAKPGQKIENCLYVPRKVG